MKFGEPEWRAEWGGRLYYGDVFVANIETPKTINYGQLCEKIAAALNALAGIEDVGAFMAQARTLLDALFELYSKGADDGDLDDLIFETAKQLAAMLKEGE